MTSYISDEDSFDTSNSWREVQPLGSGSSRRKTTDRGARIASEGDADAARPAPLSITAAMNIAKHALEGVSLTVVGEVSELSDKPGYKAVYFTLSDKTAAMPCLMWHGAYADSGIVLRTGLLVEASGYFSCYVPKGRMNFTAQSLRLAGEGDLRLRVAELARKLEREGLMDPAHKRPIPQIPQKVAVVTSPRGKAVHDCIRTLRRRWPLAEVLVCGVTVEGAEAPSELRRGLAAAEDSGADVILLVRGGGSYEDLMPFNDEALARAVAACSIPVVTGIGHEPDNSIADMVADLRCSTPTAAAEAVCPSTDEAAGWVTSDATRMARALIASMDRTSARFERLASRPIFHDPSVLLGDHLLEVDNACDRLSRAVPDALSRDANRLSLLRQRFVLQGSHLLDGYDRGVGIAASRLQDLSPLNILSRGYSVAYDEEGSVVDRVERVQVGDGLRVSVSDGDILCKVTGSEERGREDDGDKD